MTTQAVHQRDAATFRRPASLRAPALAVLGFLFLLRVIGHVLVHFAGATWLPEERYWQSGLLPYPALLAAQVLILIAIVLIVRDAWRGPRPSARRQGLGRFLFWFGVVYAGAMVLRFVLSMWLLEDWHWYTHIIPIALHLVLATFVLVYSDELRHGGRR